MPQLSIIVPVYNTEKYLHRCINSILNQTFTNFELLLIDDGSTDNSGVICDEYARKDSRIRVHHNNNKGASFARNIGLNNVRSEWITFVDSDDWIDSTLYEKMIELAYITHCDMVVCDIAMEHHKHTKYIQCPKEYADKTSLSNLRMIEGPIFSSTCNKLIKNDFFKKHEIWFDNRLGMWDDLWIIFRIRFFNPKISILNNSYYHYRMTDSPSITKSDSSKRITSQLLCASLITSFLSEHKAVYQYSVVSGWLKFHAIESLFDEGCYSIWKQHLSDKHYNIWLYRPYYGRLRVIQYFMITYGGFLGETLLRLYKKIKSLCLR